MLLLLLHPLVHIRALALTASELVITASIPTVVIVHVKHDDGGVRCVLG